MKFGLKPHLKKIQFKLSCESKNSQLFIFYLQCAYAMYTNRLIDYWLIVYTNWIYIHVKTVVSKLISGEYRLAASFGGILYDFIKIRKYSTSKQKSEIFLTESIPIRKISNPKIFHPENLTHFEVRKFDISLMGIIFYAS